MHVLLGNRNFHVYTDLIYLFYIWFFNQPTFLKITRLHAVSPEVS